MPASGTARIAAFDVIRGLCVVSMVLAHFAGGSLLARGVHVIGYADGAMGFVLLAGLLLGVVHRRIHGDAADLLSTRSLMRRVWRLYLCHLLLAGFAAVCGALTKNLLLPTFEQAQTLPEIGLAVISLRLNPVSGDLLSVYVVFLLAAIIVIGMMRRGYFALVFGLSLLTYIAAQIWPYRFVLPREPGVASFFNLGAWQFLFVCALLCGWHWTSNPVRRFFEGRVTLILSIALLVLVVAMRVSDTDPPEYAISKANLGPVVIPVAVALFVVLLRLVGWASRMDKARRVLDVLALVGRHSLFAFVVQGLAYSVVAFFGVTDRHSPFAVLFALAVLTGIALGSWGMERRARQVRRVLISAEV